MALPAVLAIRECILWVRRFQRRGDYYRLAQHRAEVLGRPLVVIGDPNAHVTRDAYGYGDMCVDLHGCPSAPAGVQVVSADISQEGSIPLPDDSAVVFVACVLEYVPNIRGAWQEIKRVCGGSDNAFIVHVDPTSFAAYVYPGAWWIISTAPPLSPEPIYTPAHRRSSGRARSRSRLPTPTSA